MIESPYLDEIVEEQVALRLEKQHAEMVAQLKKAHLQELAVLEQAHAAIMADLAKERLERIARQGKYFAEDGKAMHTVIMRILNARFGTEADQILAALEKITDKTELDALADYAVSCPDLETFRRKLPQ
jgi:hypothetical protein